LHIKRFRTRRTLTKVTPRTRFTYYTTFDLALAGAKAKARADGAPVVVEDMTGRAPKPMETVAYAGARR
jgi:hypothetical protein